MPRPSTHSPAISSAPTASSAQAWRLIRGAAVSLFVLQVAVRIENLLVAEPASRVATGFLSIGFLVLAGILTYGVWHRMRWALIVSGILSGAALPILLAFPFISGVEIQGSTFRGSPFSIPLAMGCALMLAGLILLRRSRSS